MRGANGRADPCHDVGADPSAIASALQAQHVVQRFSNEQIKQLVSELEVPFESSAIEWRVTNTCKGEKRGQVVPYADPRAYTDRLNVLFTPAGWTRKYALHTSANFERAKDNKLVAKVLVTCELTIFGLGSHSATGEGWADDPNAGTASEAQAFKRSCCCFGLGRYLYHFTGIWVDLDEKKRPKSIPRLFGWATPHGWRQGLRPGREMQATSGNPVATGSDESNTVPQEEGATFEEAITLIREIEAMAERLGKRLYRGLLKTAARVWSPREIHDAEVLRRVLQQMQAAVRDLRRLEAALSKVEPETRVPILRSLRLHSLNQVDSLETLNKVVLEAEKAAETTP
jgi:hypothetical protein